MYMRKKQFCVRCDIEGCRSSHESISESKRRFIQKLRAMGWRFKPGMHVCPKCCGAELSHEAEKAPQQVLANGCEGTLFVGQTVYRKDGAWTINKIEAFGLIYPDEAQVYWCKPKDVPGIKTGAIVFTAGEVGKTVFTTREAAISGQGEKL